MKKKVSWGSMTLRLILAALMVMGCELGDGGTDNGEDKDKTGTDDQTGTDTGDLPASIWVSESNGTLEVISNSSKDMLIFQGQTLEVSKLMGGVRANTTRTFDVSDDVTDFAVGGYLILRGITLDEYNAHKTNLTLAKIEYSAMATYGQGKKYRTEISSSYMGDYGYKVGNSGSIGLELRKNSPDGEKIAYLPKLATNVMVYSATSNALAIFPVYVYFNKSTQQVTTVQPTSHFESVTATPRPIANATSIQTYLFPNDPTVTWETIKKSLASPVAYLSVTNSVGNQGAYFTIAGSNALFAQNGYDAIGSGEQLTFEVESTVDGTSKNIVMTLYNGTIQVPVRFAEETAFPTIKNGYDYTVTLSGSGNDVANYSAVITEVGQRDISKDIESL
jgi:hypothetical protein